MKRESWLEPDVDAADQFRDQARTELFEEFVADENGVLSEAFDGPLYDDLASLGKALSGPPCDQEHVIRTWRDAVEREAGLHADRYETDRARSMAGVE